jgi:hypothetical protein
MKPVFKTRWYFWIFCLYLEQTLQWVFKWRTSVPPSHIDRSFFAFFNLMFVPLFCVWIALSIMRLTQNWMERTIIVLTAITFVLQATATLYRLNYLPIYPSSRVSHWLQFVATLLLGYRTNEVLKNQEETIEALSCPTVS